MRDFACTINPGAADPILVLMLVLMAILAVPQLMKAWHYDPDAPENRAYYSISAEARLTFTVYYLGLVVFLAMMTHELHDMLEVVRPAG
ncbi:hypothetical protein KR96_18680 [Ralstonia solanacearum]|nr:hypothetical protein KR96_18680 [Ralstonia solanacearum]